MQGHLSTPAFLRWFAQEQDRLTFDVKTIPFAQLKRWRIDEQTGNFFHDSGRFFSIQGLRANIKRPGAHMWHQPIIVQPEVGILGIITKVEAGVRYFLMQAKMEPGNINITQLSPTVQATKSNYSRVHEGTLPAYLEFFLEPETHGARVLVDLLQPEQGGRFYQKQNRNMILEVTAELELEPSFCWLTLPQLKELMRIDNLMNMDARTVLSCWVESRVDVREIAGWLAEEARQVAIEATLCPLRNLPDWRQTDREILHVPGNYFSVIAVDVTVDSREVSGWTQPLMKAAGTGLIGFIQRGDEFLLQAKVEVGNRLGVGIAPTISFSNYMQRQLQPNPAEFLDTFLQAKPADIVFDTLLSEEGGRFFHAQNRYMIVRAEPEQIPPHFRWVKRDVLLGLIQTSLCTVETRSLVAAL